jgi:uncharacterized protein YqgC (DUF456 family)
MIVVGLVGIVLPVLPGLLLVWGGIGVWAVARPHTAAWSDTTGWIVIAVATVLLLVGTVAKYAFPGRRMRAGGVPWTTLAAGTVLGVVGMFVIPVVGLVIGFVLGIYLTERLRSADHRTAWASTAAALRAVGWSLLIELATGLLMTLSWLVGLVAG